MQDGEMKSELNPQFERDLDAALRHAPEVLVPKHFSGRLLAGVSASMLATAPQPAAPRRSDRWVLPALTLAAAATFAALGIAAIDLGWAQELMQPAAVVTVLAIESALSLAWMRRVMKAAR